MNIGGVAFNETWDGGAVLETSGLMTINGVSLENAPDWHSFVWSGTTIEGTVDADSRSEFEAALAAGDTGLPITFTQCAGGPLGEETPNVTVETGSYVLLTEVRQPFHSSFDGTPKQHIIVMDELEWTYDGNRARAHIGNSLSQSPRWGFIPRTGSDAALEREAGAQDYGVSTEIQDFIVEGTGNDMLVCFVATRDTQSCTGMKWIPDTADAGDTDAFTQIGSTVTIGSGDETTRLTAWKLFEPRASVQVGGGDLQPTLSGANRSAAMYTFYVSGVSSAVAYGTDTDVGTAVSSTVTGSGGLLLDCVAWMATHGTSDDATPGAGQTEDYLNTGTGAFGDPDTIIATSHKEGGTEMSWSGITSSAAYAGAVHIAVRVG